MKTHNYTVWSFRPAACLGVILGGLLLFGGSVWLLPYGARSSKLFLTGWVLMGFVLGYLVLKKLAVTELLVVLTAEAMTIHYRRSAREQHILMSQVDSYYYADVNNSQFFRLRLHSGQKVVMQHHATFCPDDDIRKLAKAFKKRVASFAARPGNGFSAQREKTFFERPISDVVGWVLVALLLWMSGDLLLHGVKAGKLGKLLGAYAMALTFLGPWWMARRARMNSGE